MEDPTTNAEESADRAAEERAARLIGQVISQRYRIEELLAMGGMGAVYRGQHLLLKKRVAIKILHPDTENLPELVARFEREAIAGAHITHPNVVTATDFGQVDDPNAPADLDGSYFLVLEHVRGRTLHNVIKGGALPVARAVAIAKQIAAALGAVHAMGIVHRDVKPRNIMLVEGQDGQDTAKLIDFGLAKVAIDKVVEPMSQRAGSIADGRRSRLDSLLDSKPRLTGVGVIFGTIAYLAPESALGMDMVDARADLYALGLCLYEMLAGKHPFDATDPVQLFAEQRFKKPPSFTERAPEVHVPPAIEAVVMRLLKKDPMARIQTAAELADAIDRAVAAGEAPAIEVFPEDEPPDPPPIGTAKTVPAPPPAPAPSSSTKLVPAVALIALAMGVAIAIVIARGMQDSPGNTAQNAPSAAPSQVASAPPPLVVPPPSVAPPAPSMSASASVPDRPLMEGVDTTDVRALLERSLRVRDYAAGESAFFTLLERDPSVFKEPEVAASTRELASALDRNRSGDRIFEALENKLGSTGLDVLYDLVATKGKSSAAVRARSILKKEEVLARATPELRITFELREAPCVDKLKLLDRAAEEGDARTLLVLEAHGIGCFRRSGAVLGALAKLRAKLGKR